MNFQTQNIALVYSGKKIGLEKLIHFFRTPAWDRRRAQKVTWVGFGEEIQAIFEGKVMLWYQPLGQDTGSEN